MVIPLAVEVIELNDPPQKGGHSSVEELEYSKWQRNSNSEVKLRV